MRKRLPLPDPAATCLITGASSGIGEAIARHLAARGYGVTLVARRAERLRAIARELVARNGIRAEVLPCDLTDASAREQLPQRLNDLKLRVDVLVNNAGVGSFGDFSDADTTAELDQIRLLCEAVVFLCGSFVPPMLARRAGAVLIVSSTMGFQPTPKYATYAAAKAFSMSFGQSLHFELRGSGVAVTTICPGPVDTEFFSVNDAQAVRLPKAMWTTADAVARLAIDGLSRNRRMVVPGPPLRALMATSRVSPAGLQLRVMDMLLRDKGIESSAPIGQTGR